jgi:hypothetical protein
MAACTNRDSVPSGIIEPEAMQQILKDVISADHFASQYLLKDSLRQDSSHRHVKVETKQFYETVFKLHQVSEEQFRKSLDFYASRPDLLKKMFDSLSASENRHRNDLYKPRGLPDQRLRDSVKTTVRIHQDSIKNAHHSPADSIKANPPHPKDTVKRIVSPRAPGAAKTLLPALHKDSVKTNHARPDSLTRKPVEHHHPN